MTIKRVVETSSQSIIDDINQNLSSLEINKFSHVLHLDDATIREILNTTISTILILLIRSDFREHLKISEIISGNQVHSKLQNNESNTHYKSVAAKELSRVLLKKQSKLIIQAINEKYKLSGEGINMLFQHGLQLTLNYLNNITRVNKLNVRGIISHLESQNDELLKNIEPTVLNNIKIVSSNNRKRTSKYTRGGPVFKNNYAVYFPLLVVVLIAVMYFFLYLNLQ